MISVIVITYNSGWDELEKTILSILRQKDVAFEILVADDGSQIKWNDRIRELMEHAGFGKYRFADSTVNEGTVKNVYKALQMAEGDYVKVIAPGDLLYNENTLRQWYAFACEQKADICFGDAVYYRCSQGTVQQIQTRKAPVNAWLYDGQQSRRKVFVNYLLANDFILGAALLADRQILLEYISQMVDKVKYAEDYALRLMVFDGRSIIHFPQKVLWYEYGTGMSTSKNETWKKRLLSDFDQTNEIILSREHGSDRIVEKYQRFLRRSKHSALIIRIPLLKKVLKCISFPDMIWFRRRFSRTDALTSVGQDQTFIDQIFGSQEV